RSVIDDEIGLYVGGSANVAVGPAVGERADNERSASDQGRAGVAAGAAQRHRVGVDLAEGSRAADGVGNRGIVGAIDDQRAGVGDGAGAELAGCPTVADA